MRIAAVGAGFPDHYYDQEALLAALRTPLGGALLQPRAHRAAAQERPGRRPPPGAADGGLPGARRLRRRQRRLDPRRDRRRRAGGRRRPRPRRPRTVADVDALYFVSVTGIATPSIDARLINRMGLPARIKRVPIFGLGCVAGAAGHRARRRLRARLPGRGGGAALGRALLAHPPARGPLDPQPDRLGAVRRRRRGGDRGRRGARARAPAARSRPRPRSSPRARSSTPTPSG